MILKIVKSLCFIIPGIIILIVAKKEFKKELYIIDKFLFILCMPYIYSIFRQCSLSYIQYIVLILVTTIVTSFINRLILGYYQIIYSEDVNELKKIIIGILNKENILFSIIENKEDYKVIFKFSEFKFKSIVIQIHMKGIEDKIKYFTIYFKNINRKDTLFYVNEIAEYFDERQIFKKRKINIISCLISATIYFGIGIFIFLKNL